MLFIVIAWLILALLSFGFAGFIFVSMRSAAKRTWPYKVDDDYRPRVSIIVPTYNEAAAIQFKLANLSRIEYPRELTQIIVVDSNSEDRTVALVDAYAKLHPDLKLQVVVDRERKGKAFALNLALQHCQGEVVIVSDADCFWPVNTLRKALPHLADPKVSAISGPKNLLNPRQSWITKSEDGYLKSANLVKLGESKTGSTLLFEGGFSAYKREAFEMFDPYNTGSDDCGTVIKLTEKGSRAIMVPEAAFFTTFPITWRGRISIKIRRAGQLSRVFAMYLVLLLKRRITSARRIVAQDVLLYLIGPVAFVLFLPVSFLLLMSYPLLALALLLLLVPKLGTMLFEVIQNFFVLFLGLVFLATRKNFAFWKKPEDRALLTEDLLREHNLI